MNGDALIASGTQHSEGRTGDEGYRSPRKSIWVTEPSIAGKERDAMMDIHLEKPSMWIFVNPNVKGPLGHPTGYEIMPGATAASLLRPDDGAQKVGAFSYHQLWVTPYRAEELYAAGTYPNSSTGEDGLAAWTRKNRSIENTDIVAWYTLGFHHVPRGTSVGEQYFAAFDSLVERLERATGCDLGRWLGISPPEGQPGPASPGQKIQGFPCGTSILRQGFVPAKNPIASGFL